MKEFLSYLKPYKRDAVLAVFCIEAETVFELIIPLVMASIVDVGVATGDRHYILMKGLQMVLFALISLVLGQGSAMFSARCGQGLGAEIRKAEFAKLHHIAQETGELAHLHAAYGDQPASEPQDAQDGGVHD